MCTLQAYCECWALAHIIKCKCYSDGDDACYILQILKGIEEQIFEFATAFHYEFPIVMAVRQGSITLHRIQDKLDVLPHLEKI